MRVLTALTFLMCAAPMADSGRRQRSHRHHGGNQETENSLQSLPVGGVRDELEAILITFICYPLIVPIFNLTTNLFLVNIQEMFFGKFFFDFKDEFASDVRSIRDMAALCKTNKFRIREICRNLSVCRDAVGVVLGDSFDSFRTYFRLVEPSNSDSSESHPINQFGHS
ncbi:hypothetical protein RUM44_005956 [Polyplax serrata]|uniref:Saposin B-type domain-containing protein n=1 Tax=Polyplax serrata TaxID=468196 RepID=A0ABR1AYK8_POLSC